MKSQDSQDSNGRMKEIENVVIPLSDWSSNNDFDPSSVRVAGRHG